MMHGQKKIKLKLYI